MAKKDIRNGVRWQLGVTEVRDSQGFETPFGWAGSPAHRGPRQPTDHIRYSRETGFSGITPKDKEQWLRKYPHLKDFDLNVEEGEEWLSKHWDRARRVEERPREFLDWWLAGEWVPLNPNGYKEPETIYNPEQLSDFIEQYFKAGELIERLTRGKHNGLSDSLASEPYDKALGYAVKLRDVVPEFPKTPEPMGKPHVDLRRLQEWCIECETIARGLYARVKTEDVERPLALLRELDDLLKTGFPKPDETAWSKCRELVRGEIERLLKAIGELDDPSKTFSITPTDRLDSKAWYWFNQVNCDGECKPLFEKMREYGIRVPDERAELVEMLLAARWMARTDWDKIREIAEETKNDQPANIPIDKLGEQRRMLIPAQTAEKQINELAWRRYRRENPDYDKGVREAGGRMSALYDGIASALNSNRPLLKIAALRDNGLVTAFERLRKRLFEESTLEFDESDPLQDAMHELEAVRENIRNVPSADYANGPTEASSLSDPAMSIPTIEEISEIVQKLVGLKREIERIRNVAENGENPEKVKVEAQKAEEFFRKLRDTLAAKRPFGPVEVVPSVQAKINALIRDGGELPSLTEMHLAAIQGISQTFKGLPLSILRRLQTEVIPRIWRRDSEEVMAGMTVRELKNWMGIVEKAEELELMKQVRAETERVFKEVDLDLCPFQEFLQQESGSGPVQSADASSLDALIHRYKRVKRRLEVRARHQMAEQHQEKQEQTKKQTTKLRAKTTATQTPKKFRPWLKPGDACFVIDNNRILFHRDGTKKDLRLKNLSKTQSLLVMLQNGTLQSCEVKTHFCSEKTKPIQVVSRANQTLNDSIRRAGFTCLPEYDVEFIRYEQRFDHYEKALPIYASKAEFDCAQEQDGEA